MTGIPKAVVFDLDGTLIDSAPDLHAAAALMLNAIGRPPVSLGQVTGFIGNGVRRLVERCLDATGGRDDVVMAEAFARFEVAYAADPATLSAPFPGVPAMLARLKDAGLVLGVCTNKPQALAEDLLMLAGLRDPLDCIVGGDAVALKPDPASLQLTLAKLSADRSNAVYVGDSEIDAETAVAARVPFWLFTAGYRRGPVEAMQHDHRFDHFDALAPALLGR